MIIAPEVITLVKALDIVLSGSQIVLEGRLTARLPHTC
jgi:hypothetical protein